MAAAGFACVRASKQRVLIPRASQPYDRSQRTVVAAVCYRVRAKGEIEFLLVRTRGGRWTFPKGGVDGDPTAAAAAAREAYEEAGALGSVQRTPFTSYLHFKSSGLAHPVRAHLCEVRRVDRPAELYRNPTWFPHAMAKLRLRADRLPYHADQLERVIDRALRCLVNGRSSAGVLAGNGFPVHPGFGLSGPSREGVRART